MRAKQGGGTRTVVVGVECDMDTVLEKGKNFFFPKGMSTRGHETQFNFEVWDYKQNPVHEDVTIDIIYDAVGMPRLRFYIATCPKEELENDSDTDDTEAEHDDDVEETHYYDEDDGGDKMDADDIVQQSEDDAGREIADEFQKEDNILLDEQGDAFNISNIDLTSDVSDYEVTFGPGSSEHTGDKMTEPYDFEGMLQQQPPSTPCASSDSPSCTSGASSDSPPASTSGASIDLPPSTSEASTTQQPLSTSRSPKIVTIHHGNCLNEMINGFLDLAVLTQPLIIKRLLPDNTEENGTGSGAMRDVYSSFWKEFYDRCTVGTTVKVPFIRHDFNSDTWKAIGRILLRGYRTCQYLPIKLALPLVEEILYGEVCSDLFETFMQFVSSHDHAILQKALNDFSSVDTLREILLEIAHKELIQKPMYVIDCLRDVIEPNITLNHDDLVEMYGNLKPSPKREQGLLQLPVMMTPKQREVENNLKRYLRELDEEKLGKFLRFTTGSDLMTCYRIEILFSNMSKFTRRPIGHTCGRVLEVADCYENFPDFRSEFNAVFDSNIWIMDIV
ncbi:hypothetical protein F2P81_016616 [Scophthalmus maximus]|uniref:HECT domain-containing protein n=1 Tax=Scophthalmus maximus TaxID=52904 RepID=A0A6A4SLP5_SCOMX|nr:hypothetical protein F2P81_016616 [Scophthalmus maximus]